MMYYFNHKEPSIFIEDHMFRQPNLLVKEMRIVYDFVDVLVMDTRCQRGYKKTIFPAYHSELTPAGGQCVMEVNNV